MVGLNPSAHPYSFAARVERSHKKDPDASLLAQSFSQLIPLLVSSLGLEKREAPPNLLDPGTSPALEEWLGPEFLVQLRSLAKEPNPDLQCKGLILVSEELARQGKLTPACVILSWLQKNLKQAQGAWAGEYLTRVQEDLRGLSSSEASSTLRSEVWIRNLSAKLVDPSLIAGFFVGEFAYRLYRFECFRFFRASSDRFGVWEKIPKFLRKEKYLWAFSTLGTIIVDPLAFTAAQQGVQNFLEKNSGKNSSKNLAEAFAKNALPLMDMRMYSVFFQAFFGKLAAWRGLKDSPFRNYLFERTGSFIGLVKGFRGLKDLGLDSGISPEERTTRTMAFFALSSLSQGLWNQVGRGLQLQVGKYAKF